MNMGVDFATKPPSKVKSFFIKLFGKRIMAQDKTIIIEIYKWKDTYYITREWIDENSNFG